MDISGLLRNLDALIRSLPDHAFFNPPAGETDVAVVERAIGRALPETYRRFLLCHDGGFIAELPICEAGVEALASARWNANHLRGCEEIIKEYENAVALERDVTPELADWPYVPFCHTAGQEALVFGPPDPEGVHPVLDAFHEVGPTEWDVLAGSFADFLALYIDNHGFPATVASPKG